MEEPKVIISTAQDITEEIPIEKGMRLADSLSALLFIVTWDAIVKRIEGVGTINKTLI